MRHHNWIEIKNSLTCVFKWLELLIIANLVFYSIHFFLYGFDASSWHSHHILMVARKLKMIERNTIP